MGAKSDGSWQATGRHLHVSAKLSSLPEGPFSLDLDLVWAAISARSSATLAGKLAGLLVVSRSQLDLMMLLEAATLTSI